ncbi:MAG: hypothetical protein LBD36_03385 [Holosporales bacterium]|jgi:hypothetical protein|nr:hypothetical protein [Holosporales bacterium]
MLFLNYDEIPLLSILVLSPLFGAAVVTRIHPKKHYNIKNCTLWINAFAFFMATLIFMCINSEYSGIQFAEQLSWIAYDNINYYVGISYSTLIIILLFTVTFPIATILSFKESSDKYRQQMTLLLCMESSALLCLCSINVILFYISYEAAFFCFLFFIKISSNNSHKINLLSLQHIVGSSILLIILLKILYNVPNFSFETVQYGLSNIQFDSTTNSFLICVFFLMAWPLDNKSNNTGINVFLQIVPLQIIRMHIIFTLYPFMLRTHDHVSTQLLIISIMSVLCMSFIKTCIQIKHCNFIRIIYGITQAITCFTLIDLSLNVGRTNQALFINFCINIACVYLVLSIFHYQSKVRTLFLPYLLFSCFGAPYLYYIPTLQKIVTYNSIALGIAYVISTLIFISIGGYYVTTINDKHRKPSPELHML